MNPQHRNKDFIQAFIGAAVLCFLYLAFLVAKYWFGTFYLAGWEQYKTWYPNLFLVVFPIVKILPYAFLAVSLYLLRKNILSFFNLLKSIPYVLSHFSELLKSIFLKYFISVVILVITLFIVLSISEYFLRKKGFKPGYRLYSIYFKPVDSLYNIDGFYADSNGIFCISQSAREFICNELKTKSSSKELTPYAYNQSPEIYSLPEDFLEIWDSNYHSEFKTFIEKMDSGGSSEDSEFLQAVKDYIKCPINSNGFKSIEFKKYNSKRKSILLLGDSFAWGHSTTNKTNSFADLLLTKGYIVYNTGISGTDPGQYLKVAEVLIPKLQPDYVVVNFYLGNDIQYFDREPQPYMPVLYSTNAGNLVTCPEGVYINSPEEAYDYTLSVFTLPESNSFNKLCAKSTFGTLLWRALAKIGLADASLPRFKEYTRKVAEAKREKPYSDEKLRKIKVVTQKYEGKYLLIAIPMLDDHKFVLPENKPDLFEGIKYYVPTVKREYFNAIDGHFNDEGSRVYAGFIDSLVQSN